MLSRMSVKKPFTVVVAIIIIIILGVISYLNIGVDMLPGMNLPFIAVVTIYPGAAPEAVEEEITDPIEDALSEVSNIKNLQSISSEHFSLVIIEFNADADVDKAYNEVEEKLQYVTFPDDDLLQEPILLKVNPSMLPIMNVSIGMEGQSIKESGAALEDVVKRIQGVDGVSSVSSSGLINDLIYVNMKIDRLIETITDYLYDEFGINLVLPDETKAELLRRFRSQNIAEMTVDDAFGIIIDYLTEIQATLQPEQQTWVESMISFLNAERADPESYTYNLIEQLLSNKFIFREDADDGLFYSFVDELIAESVNNFFSERVSGIFTQLSPDVLAQLIYAQDFDMPAGNVTEGSIQTVVKIGTKVTTRDELLNLPVISFDLGAAYAEYFDRAYLIMDLIASRMETDTLEFTHEQLIAYIVGIQATIAQDPDSPLAFLADMSPEEAAAYVRGILGVLSGFSEGGVVVPEGTDDGEGNITYEGNYVINMPLLQQAVENIRAKLFIPLKLSSFADVTYFDNSTASLTYMLVKALNGEEVSFDSSGAVIISVNKEPDKSTVEITDDILDLLNGLNSEKGFENFRYTVLYNSGDTINFMLDTVVENLLWGALLAIVVLLLFLRNIKSTLVVGSSIAISVVFTFVLMYFSGITLNVVSMGGLAMGVGMLVDNSIVVIENIFRMRSQGKSVYTAAIYGAKQVSGAIIASTLTTMIVFLPIVFISGLTKEIFTDMALTICFSLLASLLVALTLVPMAASTFMKKGGKKETKLFRGFRRGYAKTLNFFLKHKVIPLVLVTVLFAGALYSVFTMDLVLFPDTDASTLSISATIDREGLERYNSEHSAEEYLTYDMALQEVMEQMRKVVSGTVLVREDEEDVRSELKPYSELNDISWVNAIDAVGLYVSTGLSVGGFSLGSESISVDIILVDEKQRDIGSKFLVKEFNSILERDEVNMGIFDYTVTGGGMLSALGMGTDSFTVALYGNDLDVLRQNALDFAKKFKTVDDKGNPAYTIEGVTDVSTGLETDTKEYRIVVDKTKASQYGLTVAQVYLQVASALSAVSSSNTINLYTDDISSSNNVFIYDANYDTRAWYQTYDKNGTEVNVYMKNNVSDAQNIGEYYVLNDTGKGVFIKDGEGYRYIPTNGKIPVTPSENSFVFSYITESDEVGEDGLNLIKEYETTLTRTGKEVYYGVDRINNFDLMTMPISSADLLQTGAETVIVPLYMLLDDSSFLKDENGNVMYHENEQGEMIPDGFVKTDSYVAINHTDKRKTVSVTFTYDAETASSRQIQSEIEKVMGEFEFADSLEVSLENGNPYVNEVFQSLIFVLVLAIVLIYLIMVAQFQSIKSPFIIMFTIPLAFTGGIIALLISGLPMSVMALMGLIILVGVVVNNGIVFVDYCNQLIRQGVPKRVALLRTGMDRLRPILMTALTTIVALVIMALDGSEGGALLQPLAITAIGGMIFSTLLTLFIVPIVYDLFNRRAKRTARDVALSQKLEEDDDGMDAWDEDSRNFVCALAGVNPEELAPADNNEATSQNTENNAEEAPESEETVSENGKETAESPIITEIKKRRNDVFGTGEE